MEISITTPSNNKDNTDATEPSFVTDICACCVEQGLVPQLEYIQQGIFIYRNPSTNNDASVLETNTSSSQNVHTAFYFPEGSIRTQCTTLLHHLVEQLETHANLLTRLISAMLHSGNTKLRVNIFSGLMYLTGRCPAVGRYD